MKRRYTKHSEATRIKALSLYDRWGNASRVARHLGINCRSVTRWVRLELEEEEPGDYRNHCGYHTRRGDRRNDKDHQLRLAAHRRRIQAEMAREQCTA